MQNSKKLYNFFEKKWIFKSNETPAWSPSPRLFLLIMFDCSLFISSLQNYATQFVDYKAFYNKIFDSALLICHYNTDFFQGKKT